MTGIRKITKNKKVLALIVPAKLGKEGTNFFTSSDNAFQLGRLIYPKASQIAPHLHRTLERKIKGTQELFYVEKGRVRANLYDKKGKKIKSVILNSGDTLLAIDCGHGFDFLKKSKVLVLKQGPYYGQKEDKSYV